MLLVEVTAKGVQKATDMMKAISGLLRDIESSVHSHSVEVGLSILTFTINALCRGGVIVQISKIFIFFLDVKPK